MTETTERGNTVTPKGTWFDSAPQKGNAPPGGRAHPRELFTSADLVQSLCRLHDAEYLREVVDLLQKELDRQEANGTTQG